MRNATLALLGLAALVAAPQAAAQCTGTEGTDFQRVTVREINAIPQDNIDQLNALSDAGTITIEDIQSLLTNDLEGEIVEFTAVILSDPILSGLATAVDGIPGRIHVFVRDVNAATDGVEGMGIQIVDNTGSGQSQQFFVGDEVTVCGLVQPFTGSGGKSMQISDGFPPSGILTITGTDNSYGPDDPLLQPVTASIDDFHDAIGDQTQLDFDVFSDYNGQYVRLEGTTLIQGVPGNQPNLLFSDDVNGAAPQINQYDVSACFRNDRDTDYFPEGQAPACIDDDFVPPPTGTVNVQGFLLFQGDDGNFNYGTPDEAHFVIAPFEESDFEIASAPPILTAEGIGFIPGPSDDVTISANVVAGQGVIANVTADYDYIVDGTTVNSGSVGLTNTSGDTYEGTIPAGPNGALVIYTITGTDDTGGASEITNGYRIFEGSVDSIALIQETFPGGDASLIYTGANGDDNADDPIPFALDATVQQVFQRGSVWYGSIQDDADLGPWSGVWVFFGSEDPGLSIGDQINITQAAINERFDVTQIQDLMFSVTSSGSPYAYKDVPTGVLNDTDVAEAHEGMLLTFNNVTITDNDTGFGEWAFSSTGEAADAQEADDWADAFDDFDPADFFENGEVREFIRGIWWFSFGEYKLAPVDLTDIGMVVSTSAEGGLQARSIRIEGTFPNPVASTARVDFELDEAGSASLRLFDVTGREVAVLAEGDFAAAQHSASLNVSALASGVYVLRLEAGGEIATARLAVVR